MLTRLCDLCGEDLGLPVFECPGGDIINDIPIIKIGDKDIHLCETCLPKLERFLLESIVEGGLDASNLL